MTNEVQLDGIGLTQMIRPVPPFDTSIPPADGQALARHWARVAMRRWEEAEELERADGVAFCDTDPLKLHYAWGMAALGLAPRAQFDRELARGNFDKDKLDQAIDDVKNVVENNTLSPRDRDVLAEDLRDLRELRRARG